MGLQCKQCKRGKTGTGAALEFAREKSFKKECGARSNVKKLVVVLTDGKSTEKPDYLNKQIQLMKDTGAKIVSVGVGKKSDLKELQLIASDNSLAYKVNNVKTLHQSVGKIFGSTCPKPEPAVKPNPSVETKPEVAVQPIQQDDPTNECVSKLDLLFILDASGSIGKQNFEKATSFASEIARYEHGDTDRQGQLFAVAQGRTGTGKCGHIQTGSKRQQHCQSWR
ncbi:collagen alpha-2(VI) chain [Aplysia californica]|uniref:Collagen alpha-2(VI) chain n=1 Tax=Aplysia californica TaxID=6500 RepID=A0ABM1A4G3_APLCA|nr:collagen alpha-2(VI) chain [Aplysia californica]